jgi:hypothetical protein
MNRSFDNMSSMGSENILLDMLMSGRVLEEKYKEKIKY